VVMLHVGLLRFCCAEVYFVLFFDMLTLEKCLLLCSIGNVVC